MGAFAQWGTPQTLLTGYHSYPDHDVQANYLRSLLAAHVYNHAVQLFVAYSA